MSREKDARSPRRLTDKLKLMKCHAYLTMVLALSLLATACQSSPKNPVSCNYFHNESKSESLVATRAALQSACIEGNSNPTIDVGQLAQEMGVEPSEIERVLRATFSLVITEEYQGKIANLGSGSVIEHNQFRTVMLTAKHVLWPVLADPNRFFLWATRPGIDPGPIPLYNFEIIEAPDDTDLALVVIHHHPQTNSEGHYGNLSKNIDVITLAEKIPVKPIVLTIGFPAILATSMGSIGTYRTNTNAVFGPANNLKFPVVGSNDLREALLAIAPGQSGAPVVIKVDNELQLLGVITKMYDPNFDPNKPPTAYYIDPHWVLQLLEQLPPVNN
jgi:hypothetical protein